MPDFPIIDTHLHLWDPGHLHYPWLAEAPSIAGKHTIEDYQRACGPVDVEQMVFVQCECARSQYREELAWATLVAQADPRIQGIVPWAPLEKGEAVRGDLENLIANPLVKGIRRIIQHEPDGNAFARLPSLIRGVRLLAEYDLTFDLCIGHVHMAATIELVHQCTETLFVLDHIGKPDIKGRVLDPWRAQLKELASYPNIFCKVSGLVTEADHNRWTAQELKVYLDHAIECFGFDRLMFGGDWPVVNLASSYQKWFEFLHMSLEAYTKADLNKIFYETGKQFYRLPDCESGSR